MTGGRPCAAAAAHTGLRTIGASARLAGRLLLLLVAGLGLLARPAAAQTEVIEYYGHDALGSVRIVFTASGVATARADYEPFGEGVTIAGMPAGPLPAQQFTGQERDALERQDYFGARYYRPRHGRFSQVDPVYAGLFDPQQWNRYAYARNNPLSFVDPDGRAISCYETGRGVRCNEDLTVTPESGSPHGPPLVLISGREPDCVPGLASRACGFVKNPVRGQPDPGDRRRRNREILVPLEPTPTDHDGAANSGGNSSGDGGANSTIDILLAMVEGFVIGAGQGLAASVDGAIPFADPFARMGAYDLASPGLGFSYNVGGMSLQTLALAGPLRAALPIRGTLGQWKFKFDYHNAHHRFGTLGKWDHLQLNRWRPGVHGSGESHRVWLPWRS